MQFIDTFLSIISTSTGGQTDMVVLQAYWPLYNEVS